MSSLLRSLVLIVLVTLAGGLAGAFARTIDPHRIYEENCGDCHAPHAGNFVHDNLVHSDGKILGRKSGRELRAFLEAGHGKLTPDEIVSIIAHLMSIQQSGRLFHDKCIICHDRAVKLARSELIIRDAELIGRYSKRNIEQFLSGHGRLKVDEVSKMVDVLKRQLNTLEEK